MPRKKADATADAANALAEFEAALEVKGKGQYVLRLYVTGMTPKSRLAIENVRKICEEHLEGRYQLEIIDIFQQPIFAKEGQIIAAPTLVKELPPPPAQIHRRHVQDRAAPPGTRLKDKKVTA